MTSLRAAALTDIGRVRQRNEDRYLLDLETGVFGVADGVGGLPGGADAAQRSVDEVAAALRDVAPGEAPDLTAITQQVNFNVHVLGLKLSPSMGIGSTLTFGQVSGGVLHIAHVGDSRCYGYRQGKIQQLTEDHSVENEAKVRRARGETVYYHEANRNALTRCIGQPSPPMVDLIDRQLEAGDRYLFCTDGVTRLVRDSELCDLIDRDATPDEILQEIVSLAVRRGGPDNATGVMVIIDSVS
ncbi:MAG: protein serine/threonine phosphatase [Verrucomicrobia bacterium]|nr:protein serine/threonine phosphatase [Verrucomicrobiota bacterium]